jgi:hypothetical protein
MQTMAVDISRLHVGAAPLKPEASFDQAQAEAVFLRDIRHHDDHAPLAPGNLTTDYLR